MLGYLIVGVFALCWLVSMAIYRLKGYDRLEIHSVAGRRGRKPGDRLTVRPLSLHAIQPWHSLATLTAGAATDRR
jgi:hypothetical protein